LVFCSSGALTCRSQFLLPLTLAASTRDFTISASVLSELGITPAAVGGATALPPRHPEALLTRKTHAALKDVSRLASRLAAMDRHDRDVVFQLERRRLKLASDNTPLAISEIHSSSQTPLSKGYLRPSSSCPRLHPPRPFCARVYSDSDADITRVPSVIYGKPYIRTADADKDLTAGPAFGTRSRPLRDPSGQGVWVPRTDPDTDRVYWRNDKLQRSLWAPPKGCTPSPALTFVVNKPSFVYVLRDSRGTAANGGAIPAWLASGFVKLNKAVEVTDDGLMVVYRSGSAMSGRITLGGNADPPSQGYEANYAVLVAPVPQLARPVPPPAGARSLGTGRWPWALPRSPGRSRKANDAAGGKLAAIDVGCDPMTMTGCNSTVPLWSWRREDPNGHNLPRGRGPPPTITCPYIRTADRACPYWVETAHNFSIVGTPLRSGFLRVGAQLYTDKGEITFTNVPTEVEGLPYIRTPDADKDLVVTEALTFVVNKPSFVYVLRDSRGTAANGGAIPAWLAEDASHALPGSGGFEELDMAAKVSNEKMGSMVVYRSRKAMSGRITLGGNAAPPSQGYGGNYVVAVRRQWEPPEAREHKEDVTNNYRTSMGGQQPKGVGTARIGDPVLNKYDKSIYRRRCEVEGDCITSDWRTLSNAWKNDDGHRLRQRFWRNTKQVDRSIDISANQDMKAQLAKLVSDTQSSIVQCGAQFKVVSDEAVHHCERRAVRHTCYIFQSQSQVCDDASASRHNRFDETVYFARSGLPSACQSEQRKHLVRLCDWAEKLPGVAMSHWPWQVNFCKSDLLYEEKRPTT
jgi:hypothetical protein